MKFVEFCREYKGARFRAFHALQCTTNCPECVADNHGQKAALCRLLPFPTPTCGNAALRFAEKSAQLALLVNPFCQFCRRGHRAG
jgi:hypothetical protein